MTTLKRRDQRVLDSLSTIRRVAYKAADTSRTATVTLADDLDLQLPVAIGEKWAFKFVLFVNEAASDVDLKLAIDAPGTPVKLVYDILSSPAAAADAVLGQRVDVETGNVVNLTISEKSTIVIHGYVECSASVAGSLKLQWAQGTSNAALLTIEKGSHLIADKLA